MIDADLIKPHELDRLLRYPRGRSARLARRGKLPHISLPDGEIRFLPEHVEQILRPQPAKPVFPWLPKGGCP